MSELLPTIQAQRIRRSLVDYLTTTFALSDADVRDGLDRFLTDPESGMFKGPYVRLRLPFRPADLGWRDSLDWYEGPPPYGHQAEAFARLASAEQGRPRRPKPTLVTTGTGSGKTEAFLHPILDHVLRARRAGVAGTKALILYPMNALANDQAQRLTRLLTENAELAGITAALYTGETGPKRTSVTVEGLITDRAIIRDTAPDILLTNYKMLDQLLLRRDDQALWQQSATSLQYLVLDEFHTYDGAQGTDVAMLLRRLGLTLKSHWPVDDAGITEADRDRPLGRITPVATSATLGDKGDPEAMLDFAETIFGEPFGPDAVVTESRMTLDEWSDGASARAGALGFAPVDGTALDPQVLVAALDALGDDPDGRAVADILFAGLYGGPATIVQRADDRMLLDLLRAHPLVRRVIGAAADAISLDDLVIRVDDTVSFGRHGQGAAWAQLMSYVVAAIGHVRSVAGRDAPSVEVHFWVRELTRIDRAADTTPNFRWSDDGPPVAGDDPEGVRPSFPAIFCRHCGRSGWGVGLDPVGESVVADVENIRRRHAQREGRFRPLISATGEAEYALGGHTVEGLAWYSVRARSVDRHAPAADDPELTDGWLLPVLTLAAGDDDGGNHDTCPACGQEDGIRFLGSAIATLLSVSLSTLFGSAALDPREKKALVFTDSVQDAAHRAGFVQARSHTLTLRGVLRAGVQHRDLGLDELVDEVVRAAGDNPFDRYRLLAPDCADRPAFDKFWSTPNANDVPREVRGRVRTRLALDIALEFGLNSRLGRTLELTGTVAAEVSAGRAGRLAASARAAIEDYAWQQRVDGPPTEHELVAWVRGVLDRMRVQGAIDHPWFTKYREQDGSRYSIWGGRPRGAGMPAFPRGRPAPAYPRVGGRQDVAAEGLDTVTSPKSWYALWASRALGLPARDGAVLTKLLLERLAREQVLTTTTSDSGATVYAIPASGVVVSAITPADLESGRHLLACDTCQATTPGAHDTIDQLDGAPCLVARCGGRLRRQAQSPGFYRALYESPDMRRVVAREHSSLLEDAERLEYENGFKAGATNPQAPNVLVATPTLEMGIDIGDLSAVLLASLPRRVANYVQRVGRAGRLTGNALDLAFVTGRGEHLPKLGDPLSVINGEVRPPATYLQAEEILRRQYLAHLADTLARDTSRAHPRTAADAMASVESGSYFGDLIDLAERDADAHVDRFTATFGQLPDTIVTALRVWARPVYGPQSSELAVHLARAQQRWQQSIATLRDRVDSLDLLLPELEERRNSPAATDEDQRAWRSAIATKKMTAGELGHLRGEYWIGVLEEHGILPNYTLLGDAVLLDVGVSWVDPDDGSFQSEHGQIRRASVRAIHEFAPGATFYGRGYEIEIDALDLGAHGAAIRPWVFCPACGFAQDIALGGTEQLPSACPRCGSPGIADTGQRLRVVELQHVTAEIRRDEATISDRRDERTNKNFQILVTADVDPTGITDRWFVEDVKLGVTYAQRLTMRWVNLGGTAHGSTRTISGEERAAGLFRVCEGCGKKDIEAGRNLVYEHRPWCQHRRSPDEHNVDVALSRTLTTQGLLVRLPFMITVGDDFAVPSLSAALLLGLREQLGGHPDHIGVQRVVDPTLSDGTDNHDALLLHDTVPGGTGYLAELAEPDRLRGLLALAWKTVRDCECRHEERLACHRCLLPFAPPGALNRVSRAAAERHLRALLGVAPEADSLAGSGWTVSDAAPVEDPESHLEQHFRKVVLARLKLLGAAVQLVPGVWGNTVRFTLPGDGRQWTLTPQVLLENSRPDFLLQSTDTTVPAVAIFTDGRMFHATVAHNRLADDAAKRQVLRETGRIVLAVTARDLDETPLDDPPWYAPGLVPELQQKHAFMTTATAYESLRKNPIDWLIDWISSPTPDQLRTVARAVPLMLPRARIAPRRLADGAPLSSAAATSLVDAPMADHGRTVAVYRDGALAVAFEPLDNSVIAVSVVLDDRTEALGELHADGWRSWLRLSNALVLRDWPVVITTVSRVATEVAAPTPVATQAPELSVAWRTVWQQAREGAERDLVVALAALDEFEPPSVGAEGPGGIMLDLSWTNVRVVVDVDGLDETDQADLVEAGWQVVGPDVDLVATTLRKGNGEA